LLVGAAFGAAGAVADGRFDPTGALSEAGPLVEVQAPSAATSMVTAVVTMSFMGDLSVGSDDRPNHEGLGSACQAIS
jgi:hypothetical protein